VADALIAADERGVDVRLVYDDEHTEDDPQMQRMVDAGIEAVPDERSAFMHNKFFVFDNSTVWLGSWNVTTNDTFRNNNNVIIMRSTQLAENYIREFEEMARGEFGVTSPSDTPNQAFTLNGIQIESYFASEDAVMPRLIEFVNGATASVHFMAFSFTDDALADAMIGRVDAGLPVAGIFEQRGANTEHSSCPPLLDAGADVRLDGNGYTFHHKIIIVDGKSVAIGSFNFSANAAESNDENMIIVHDPRVAALYEQEFNKQFSQGQMPVGGECLTD
jgi:phosphatidylserine/phosphatidylglycerophosphate/cardiolipin synthase-like enzyme